MYKDGQILIAKSADTEMKILLGKSCRHGLITGATGTGKTISLKVLAESYSDAGVPVFLADVKGDLAGMCEPGVDTDDMKKRISSMGLDKLGFSYKSYPTRFWDIMQEHGLALRTTISEFGPLLLARLMDLNPTQSDILDIVFKIADAEQLILLDIKDLKAMINHVSEHASEYKANYGNMAPQSLAAIMRSIVALEGHGADKFFGEPALDIKDWFATDSDGRGMINILDSRSLISDPVLYSTFLLWMLSELFEELPEVGDVDKPKMVFFFDEAHLLFDDTPKALMSKIEQVMKLIRSKGIGVYFISQVPSDIPDEILAQLGNKIQHGLRAYTPADQKAVKAAAESYRVNPKFDTAETIMGLGTGEAVVSFLQEDGSPSMAEKVSILPPQSKMGTIDDTKRSSVISADTLSGKYKDAVDRESAYEILTQKVQAAAEAQQSADADAKQKQQDDKQTKKDEAKQDKEKQKEAAKTKKAIGSVAGTAAGTIGRELGNELGKSVGGSFGKRLGGNVGASIGRGLLKTLLKL